MKRGQKGKNEAAAWPNDSGETAEKRGRLEAGGSGKARHSREKKTKTESKGRQIHTKINKFYI